MKPEEKEYLVNKINYNQELIDNYEARLKELYSKKDSSNKIGDHLEIKNIEENVNYLKQEINGWKNEIKTNNFKGYY